MPPLDGLKVVDLTRVLAGPFCAMLLGDMGADVVKVEEPVDGDDARMWGPFVGEWSALLSWRQPQQAERRAGSEDAVRRTGAAIAADAGGRRDRKFQAGQSRQARIRLRGGARDEPAADLLLDQRLRTHRTAPPPDRLRPRSCRPSRASWTSPVWRMVRRSGPASPRPTTWPDLYAFGGILLALRERDRTGRGQEVDIALFDSILSMLSMPAGIYQATGKTPRRMGNDHSAIAPYEVLSASDGMLMVAAANRRLWAGLCEAVDVPELAKDPRFATNGDRVQNRTALKAALERAFSRHTVASLLERLQRHGIPCGRVRTVPEALEDPQVRPRQMFIEFDDPELGGFRVLGNPIKLSDTPADLSRRPPKLGEHTQAVLDELGILENVVVPDRTNDRRP